MERYLVAYLPESTRKLKALDRGFTARGDRREQVFEALAHV
jgi:hypothetical protein